MTYEHFSYRLSLLRQAKNWTLDTASKKSGLSGGALSKLEGCASSVGKNHEGPRLDTLCRIRKAYGVSLDELADEFERRPTKRSAP